MNKYKLNIIMLSVTFFSLITSVNAQTMDAHVHGLSELTIAMEKHELEIEMISPAMNIVGFEHKATTEENITAVQEAIIQLNNHKAIFSFSGGECLLVDKEIDAASMIDSHHLEVDSHNDVHKNESKQEHESEHEHEHDSEESNHYEIVGHYRYHCKKESTLSTITVKIFDQFSGIDQIMAKWITQKQQGSVILNPSTQIIKLR